MKRIQKFLLCDEINETLVTIDRRDINGISIKNANFHWGLKNEPVEDKHSKVLKARKGKKREFKVLEEDVKEQQ